MALNKGKLFAKKDMYIDYSFEEIMYRWDHVARKIYVKFYGEKEKANPIAHDNRLFNDALLSGKEITYEEYLVGKSVR